MTEQQKMSHPSRVRGLKLVLLIIIIKYSLQVAPFTGAWIETLSDANIKRTHQSRTLHGCVD